MDAKILFYLLGMLEGGPSHNKLNLTRGFVKDVTNHYGLKYDYDRITRSRGLRRYYTLLYLRKYKALGSYEKAIRVFTGGFRGRNGARATKAWKRAEKELKRIKKLQGRVP